MHHLFNKKPITPIVRNRPLQVKPRNIRLPVHPRPRSLISTGSNRTNFNIFGSIVHFNNQDFTQINGDSENKYIVGSVYCAAFSSFEFYYGGNFSHYQLTSCGSILKTTTDELDPDDQFIVNSGTGFSGRVYSIAIQSDGKILVGGDFSSYNGNTRNRIIRLNSDGTIDSGFSIGTGFNNTVLSIAIQSDGKILVGGNFSSYNGNTRNRIIRLNSDGTIDSGFNIGTGFSNSVTSIAIQSDGKILVGGVFTSYNGDTRNRIIRLNSNGTIDYDFSIGTGFNDTVNKIFIHSTGSIIVGGYFTSYNGNTKNRIAVLDSTGPIDEDDLGPINIGNGLNGPVFDIVEGNGNLLIVGNFTDYNGTLENMVCINGQNVDVNFRQKGGFGSGAFYITSEVQKDGKILVGGFGSLSFGRLNDDGSIDSEANFDQFNDVVNTIKVENDGKILLGGWFTQYDGITFNRIIRLHTNGNVDSSFNIGTGFSADDECYINKITTDNVCIGRFNGYNGDFCNYIAKLGSDGSLNQAFKNNGGSGFDGETICIASDPLGGYYVGGVFSSYDGNTSQYLVKIRDNGEYEDTFDLELGFNGPVQCICVLNDMIIVGGEFTTYRGVAYNRIVALKPNGDVDTRFKMGNGFDSWNSGFNSAATNISIHDNKLLVTGNFLTYREGLQRNIVFLDFHGNRIESNLPRSLSQTPNHVFSYKG